MLLQHDYVSSFTCELRRNLSIVETGEKCIVPVAIA